jgi:16S rRNA processing protein RimM
LSAASARWSKQLRHEKAPESISTSSSPDFLVVAQVLAPHGIRGEVKCRIVTDFPNKRFKRGSTLFVDGVSCTLQAARVQGQTALLKFEGIADRDAAERLRGKAVQIKLDDAVALPKGQFYWHQVIGLQVQDAMTGDSLGTITDILETGANDVYVATTNTGGEFLIPAIKDVVKDIDPAQGRVLIAPLPGMLPR